MYKVAIGSDSAYKVNAIESAILGLDIDAQFIFAGVASEISEQPKAVNETKTGSINRAKNILALNPECDFGIGVEFGYEPIGTTYHMICWATIITKDGNIFSEASSTLELPKMFVDYLNNGTSISDGLEVLLEKVKNNHTRRQFDTYIRKRRIIYECVMNVALRWYFDKDFYQ